MISVDAKVLANMQLSGTLWYLELQAAELPELVVPGQFVQLQLTDDSQHVLRRPFSVYRIFSDDGAYNRLALLYQTVGAGTRALCGYGVGTTVNLVGPLGQGWRQPVYARRVLLVAGGAGWAALALAAGSFITFGVETHLLVGARNADYLQALNINGEARPYPLEEYGTPEQDGTIHLHLATDDGSLGFHGMNTELVPQLLENYEFDYIAACGPEPMMRIVAEAAILRGIVCEVSLERRMACGMGSCLSCSVQTAGGRRKVCTDGPVFGAGEVIW